MKRTAINNPGKQEIRIRQDVSHIMRIIDNIHNNKSMHKNVDQYLASIQKVFPEAVARIRKMQYQLNEEPIEQVMMKDAEIGNYPMTHERFFELIELLPEGLFDKGMPLKSKLSLQVRNVVHTPIDLYTLYLKSVKPHLISK